MGSASALLAYPRQAPSMHGLLLLSEIPMRSLFLVCCLSLVVGAAETDSAADHLALRQLLEQATTALNTQKSADLSQLLAPEATLTFVDQTRCRNASDVEVAFKRWLGPDTDLAKVTFAPKVDGPATIIGNTALATGVSDDIYQLKDGTIVTVPTMWSATVIKNAGVWRVASLHCSVNVVDNPILTIARERTASAWQKIALAALTAGLAFGAYIGYRFGIRRLSRLRSEPAP